MTFTGNEGEQITLIQATAWCANFRSQAGSNPTKAHAYGKNKLMNILDQDGCYGIRAYYAIDDTGVKQLVLVGVDVNGCDMTTGYILDKSVICPPYCDTISPLCK